MRKKASYILLMAVVLGLVPLGIYLICKSFRLPVVLCPVCMLLFALLVIGWSYRRKPERLVISPADWFFAAALGWLMAGLLYGRFTGRATVDILVHDTFFVLTNLFMFDGMAVVFGLIAAFYYLLPAIGCHPLEKVPGQIHFWMSFTGILLLLYVSIGQRGASRYVGFSASDYEDMIQSGKIDEILPWVLAVVLAAQGVFLFNIVYSALRRRN